MPRGIKRKGRSEAAVEPEEIARRHRQKELREIALRLRHEGKVYNKNKYRQTKSTRQGHKPRRVGTLQLILIPVFWEKNEEEAKMVLKAVDIVQGLLRSEGIKCDTDSSRALTPGQKYRAWEEKNVRFRIELGPQEAKAKTAVFAVCGEPGTVAKKMTLPVGHVLVQRVKDALGAV